MTRRSGAATRGRCRPKWRRDRGSGTVWVASFLIVLTLAAVAVAMVGAGQTARHRAEAAADLAALAGAQTALDDPDSACAEAGSIAQLNSATVVSCDLDGEIVSVRVSVSLRLGRFGVWQAIASARAGPVDS